MTDQSDNTLAELKVCVWVAPDHTLTDLNMSSENLHIH